MAAPTDKILKDVLVKTEPDLVTKSENRIVDNKFKVAATELVRIQQDTVTIASSDTAGKVLVHVVVNADLPPAGIEKDNYTFYRVKDLKFVIAPFSSFGLSSGSMQVGYIVDPEDFDLGTNLTYNLDKMVRTQGSITLNSRDSLVFKPNIGKRVMWTKTANGNKRQSELGHFVIVVRSPPGTGDQVDFNLTIEAEYEYMCPTLRAANPFAFSGSAAGTMKLQSSDGKLAGTIAFQNPNMPDEIHLTLAKPYLLEYTHKLGDLTRRETTKVKFLTAKRIDFSIDNPTYEFVVPTRYTVTGAKHLEKLMFFYVSGMFIMDV